MKEHRDPYLAVQDPRIMMKGPDAPRSTIFGALGVGGGAHGFVGVAGKSLGGLVRETKSKVKVHDSVRKDKGAPKMEHGHYAKDATKIPGVHCGQVPYPGFFMKAVGPRL